MAAQISAIRTDYRQSAASMLPKAVTVPSIRFQDLLDRARTEAASASNQGYGVKRSPGPQTLSKSLDANYAVRSGDTLSGICDAALRRQGQTPSGQAVTDAVQKVAKASHITNVDRISVGQKLDLASLNLPQSAGSAKYSAPSASNLKPADEVTALIQSLIAKRATSSAAKSDQGVLDGPLRISSAFGTRADPFTGTKELHAGVDLAAAPGAAIHPFEAGQVVFSGWQAGYGNTVIVQHTDGLQTVYAHTQKNMVHQGDEVTGTTEIAQVGSTGHATGPHLHFEIRKAGTAIDPSPYLRQSSMQMARL